MSKSNLTIRNFQASVADKQILKGIDLIVKPGEVHAIMGPNGSGKSTLAYSLAGHPAYDILPGSGATLDGQDLLSMSPDERSKAGLFLAFQYPIEIPGVRVQNFLRLAYNARFAENAKKLFPTVLAFREHLQKLAADLKVKPELLKRGLNEGFSGGEKKRLEILQMAVLEPKFAILDETDSGLDIDAIKAVAEGVKAVIARYNTGIIVITHYQRILEYLQPNFVHVVIEGKVVESGGADLVKRLEEEGYKKLGKE